MACPGCDLAAGYKIWTFQGNLVTNVEKGGLDFYQVRG
jgi:hypothetical protein